MQALKDQVDELSEKIYELELINDYKLKLSRLMNKIGEIELLLSGLECSKIGKTEEFKELKNSMSNIIKYIVLELLPEFQSELQEKYKIMPKQNNFFGTKNSNTNTTNNNNNNNIDFNKIDIKEMSLN